MISILLLILAVYVVSVFLVTIIILSRDVKKHGKGTIIVFLRFLGIHISAHANYADNKADDEETKNLSNNIIQLKKKVK